MHHPIFREDWPLRIIVNQEPSKNAMMVRVQTHHVNEGKAGLRNNPGGDATPEYFECQRPCEDTQPKNECIKFPRAREFTAQ